MRSTIGTPHTGMSGFGVAQVNGRSRVPSPAARTTALRTFIARRSSPILPPCLPLYHKSRKCQSHFGQSTGRIFTSLVACAGTVAT